ncbi:biotin synthase BioB [Ruegeria sp. SCPT10]|uniref:biotin synthase BioB n=1 Tax=Ruegeria sp. SCP10 TaxID=3141377 RepID=UPI0033359995
MSSAFETWTRKSAQALPDLPLMDLLFCPQTLHRANFDPNKIQTSKLLSIKKGGCAEDCAYCSQSARNGSKLSASKLIEVERVLAEASKAKAGGATRFCMGAAWREPKDRDMDALVAMVEGVRGMGMETCMTLGMLDDNQVFRLRDAGLDNYNHYIDASERYYSEVITTRTLADRINTLNRVKDAGIKVCSGGILGMGEKDHDRIDMLLSLANLNPAPDSVPINMLMPNQSTRLTSCVC